MTKEGRDFALVVVSGGLSISFERKKKIAFAADDSDKIAGSK